MCQFGLIIMTCECCVPHNRCATGDRCWCAWHGFQVATMAGFPLPALVVALLIGKLVVCLVTVGHSRWRVWWLQRQTRLLNFESNGRLRSFECTAVALRGTVLLSVAIVSV